MRRKMGSQRQAEAADQQQQQRPIIDPMPESGGDMSLSDIVSLFLRHWLWIVVIVGGIVGATFAYVSIVAPVYTAKGQVHIQQPSIQVSQQALIQVQRADITDIPNEVALLRSRGIVAEVIRKLNLQNDPEFLEGVETDMGTPPMDQVIEAFLGHLSVTLANPDTRVIDITFNSEESEKAARIVNTLMQVYVDQQISGQRAIAENATAWLEDTVAEMRSEVEAADAAVKAFRSSTGIIRSNTNTDVTAEKVADLNTQLVQAQADEAALRAELQALQRTLSAGRDASAAPRVLNSPLIQRLREREVELVRRQASLANQYGERHPRMIQVRNELRDVRTNIEDEVSKIVQSMRSEVGASSARLAALRESLVEMEQAAVSTRGSEDELAELERDAQEKRAMLQNFLVRLRETRAQQQLVEPTASVHSPAEIPSKPSFPEKGKMLGIAGFLGIILAGVIVMVLGSMRRTFESPEEIERVTGYRPIGIVPRLSGVGGGKRTAQKVMEAYANKSNATFAQALKGVRSTLFLANGSRAPKTVLVTSSAPDEGKTTFALAYAILCSTLGERTILLDCDFGRPDLHKKMNVANDLGMANYLMGEVDLDTVIRKDVRTGMDYVVSGALPSGTAELSRSEMLKSVLDQLAWEYDTVVIDSAPVLAMSDSQLLSTMVDTTIFVVRWRHTRIESVVAAANRLEDLGARSIAGFVMSNVSVPRVTSSAASGYYAAYHR